MSGHVPETDLRTGGDCCIGLGYATTAQFIEKRLWPFCHCRQRYERNLRRMRDAI
jgi:hypothetical protein